MSGIALMLLGAKGVSAAQYWIATLSGGTFDRGSAVGVDSTGNVYMVGRAFTASDDYETVLVKYDGNGSVQWQRTLGATSGDEGAGLAIDTSGNVYIAGSTTSTGSWEAFVAKYNPSGTLQWQRTLGGIDVDYGFSVALDASANVYIAGAAASQGAGDYDLLIAKYDSSGAIQWQRTLGGTADDTGYGIAVGGLGGVYVAGGVASAGAGGYDAFLVKYNSSGTLQWQRVLGGANTDGAYAVAADASDNAYLLGYTNSQGSGGYDILLAKYDSSGTIQWQRSLGGASTEIGYGVTVDSSGNPYIVGYTTTQGAGSADILVAKYNSSGALQWQRILGDSFSNSGYGIVVDSTGNMYATGRTDASPTKVMTFKLPSDGTLTGTYGGYTYAVSTLTSATTTLTDSAAALTSATSTLTDAAGTMTSAVSTLTPTLISVV